jgi:hypothetical protein
MAYEDETVCSKMSERITQKKEYKSKTVTIMKRGE